MRADAAILRNELGSMIEAARKQAAVAANATLTLLHSKIGHHVRPRVLEGQRAKYAVQIVSTPSRRLSSSDFLDLVALQDSLKRDFCFEMCRAEGWSVRALRERIASMLVECAAPSKEVEVLTTNEVSTLRASDELTPTLVLDDSCMLGFLGIREACSESDLEAAALPAIERFFLALGAASAFVEPEKCMMLDGDDARLRPFFCAWSMERLVAVEFGTGAFHPTGPQRREWTP